MDKISPNHQNWVQDKNLPSAKEVASAYKIHPKNSIQIMDPFTHTTSLTHNIFFKNRETILVCWSIPTGNKGNRYRFFYDEYSISSGKLELINTYQQAELNRESEKLFGESGANALSMPREYCILDNYLISFSKEVPFDIFSDTIQKTTIKDYYQKVDDYYIDNSTKQSILIYKFK